MILDDGREPIHLAAEETGAGAPFPLSRDRRPGLISVIVPTFNRLAMLQELLSSLEDQDWRPIQIVVVDDGSDDGTLNALRARSFRGGIDVVILRQENRGPAAARNRGLSAANGEFVYFVDSDDLVLPHGLSALAISLQNSSKPYCLARVRNVDGLCNALADLTATVPRVDETGIVGSCWPIHAALYRREVLQRAGPFNEWLRRGEDAELLWRVLATSGPGLQIDEYVALRRFHSAGRISDDATPLDLGSSVYRMISCFLPWAEAHGALHPKVAMRTFRLLSIAMARLHAAGDMQLLQGMARLGERLEKTGTKSFLFRFMLSFKSPQIFGIVVWVLHRCRDVRNNGAVLVALVRGGARRIRRRILTLSSSIDPSAQTEVRAHAVSAGWRPGPPRLE
jgi:glycosyltransferase involved in cell wall biosynthesis